MPLHLVGETIDRRRAHALAQSGELTPLLRGVYADAADDVEAIVLAHAARIAHYLYPTAYLSSASAVLLAPTSDGRLFISGRRNQRTRIRALEIVQNAAPDHPSTVPVIVGDDLGELRLDASSPRQRFLEAFRLRSEHASAITEAMRREMAERLQDEYGDPRSAADALWTLARENGWYREGEAAERYLLRRPARAAAPGNKAALEFTIAWHGEPLGRLRHDGYEWRWTAASSQAPPLVRETTPGKLPPFLESLLPEGWLAQVLKAADAREALKQGKRYLSNIAVVTDRKELTALPPDVLTTELGDFTDAGRFTGRYAGPGRGHIDESFQQRLAEIFARAETPRLSGVQIKAPMWLSPEGDLLPATDAPFTHILKPAGSAGFEHLPVVEWFCLQLGGGAGFDVPAVAMAAMPEGMPPALVVERFDVRRGRDDRRRLALEDFCSVLDVPAEAKYEGTIERVGRALRPLSTDPRADLELLLKRALFAWVIADGDMHLKNLALLKIAEPGARRWSSVRFAPLYDAVTTRVFPGLAGDRTALKLNGKDDRLTPQDFRQLARTLELPADRADAILSGLAQAVLHTLPRIALPPMDFADRADEVIGRLREIVQQRAGPFVVG
ncbi:type II toxin-antitoxin system HipA family toxin [Phenylobacterium terrae]|uniref:Type II toxin-antitoxin system HipA family toxin n=1 Tax=Phenylobacterium terrae TaxID=2665495 RepID=A0ABW4N7J1_9CAUL